MSDSREKSDNKLLYVGGAAAAALALFVAITYGRDMFGSSTGNGEEEMVQEEEASPEPVKTAVITPAPTPAPVPSPAPVTATVQPAAVAAAAAAAPALAPAIAPPVPVLRRVATTNDFSVSKRFQRSGYYETLTCTQTPDQNVGVLSSNIITSVTWNCVLVPGEILPSDANGTLGFVQTDATGRSRTGDVVVPDTIRRVGAWKIGMEAVEPPALVNQNGLATLTVAYNV